MALAGCSGRDVWAGVHRSDINICMRTCIHARKLALRIVWRMASATLLDSDDIVSRVVFVLAAYESKGLTVSHVMRRRHALKNKKFDRANARDARQFMAELTAAPRPPSDRAS